MENREFINKDLDRKTDFKAFILTQVIMINYGMVNKQVINCFIVVYYFLEIAKYDIFTSA